MSRQIWEWEGVDHVGRRSTVSVEGNGPEHYFLTIHEGDEMAMAFIHRDVLEDLVETVLDDLDRRREVDGEIDGEIDGAVTSTPL